MKSLSRGTVGLTGAVLVAALVAVVPGPSSAAPPPAPNYECSTQASAPSANPTKIMIAGDSITNASAGDYTWPYWLWRDQIDQGANIDFVGRFKDTIEANTLVQGSRAYLDCDFDQDHEARPGVKLWTAKAQNTGTYSFGTVANANPAAVVPYYPSYDSWMEGAAATYKPDVIVLFAGANDLNFTTGEPTAAMTPEQRADFVIDKLKLVIDEARTGSPGVDVVITTVPSTATGNLYNAKLPSVVSAKNTSNERVVLATVPSWSNHSWDGLHPDAVGEVAIAATIGDALHAINPALPGRPSTLATPAIGPRFPAVLSPAQTDGDNRVKLTWSYPPGADRARIWARDTAGGSWQLKADLVKQTLRDFYPSDGTATCSVPCTTYTATGLSGGTTWEFKVQIGKGHAVAPESAVAPQVQQVAVSGPVFLGQVTQLSPVAGVHNVSVRWNALSGATGYQVRWRVAGSATWAGPASATGSPRLISGLVAGRKYGFQVRGTRSGSTDGAWSTEVFGIPKATTLAAGKKPVLSQLSGLRIKATWAASSGANKYQVQRRLAGGAWKTVATTTSRTLTSGKLVKGKTYEFRIRPYDGDVGGAYSPVAKRKVT